MTSIKSKSMRGTILSLRSNMNSFEIKGKLPSLNDYIRECRANKFKANSLKKDTEQFIGYCIAIAVANGKLKPTDKPCIVHFEWHDKSRRDYDNICGGGRKFILDALQKNGVIVNDNQKYIKGFTDTFIKDKKDYVIVTLEEKNGTDDV